jgi:hypothetical protein
MSACNPPWERRRLAGEFDQVAQQSDGVMQLSAHHSITPCLGDETSHPASLGHSLVRGGDVSSPGPTSPPLPSLQQD